MIANQFIKRTVVIEPHHRQCSDRCTASHTTDAAMSDQCTDVLVSVTRHYCVCGAVVSKVHALLTCSNGTTWQLQDLGSSNGTFLNGVSIGKGTDHSLKSKDELCLGKLNDKLSLKYLFVEQHEKPVVPARRLLLQCICTGEETPLADGDTTLGRVGTNVVLVSETANVSKKHATVSVQQGRCTVRDHSSNGTFLNGSKIQKGVAVVVQPNDVIRFGTEDNMKHQLRLATPTTKLTFDSE